MKPGDQVHVYPEGRPEKATPATVVIGGSARSIAVSFGEDPPDFAISGGGIAYHPEHGIMMLASLLDDGLWQETFHGDRFVIKEV